MEEKTCNNCRFNSYRGYKCKNCVSNVDGVGNRLTDPLNWKPLTEAQILEIELTTNKSSKNRLLGTISTGYEYVTVSPQELEEKDKEIKNIMPPKDYNKMFTESLFLFDPRQEIVDVIFNDPATIVFWKDGTKTIVKAEEEAFDPEKGLAMAIAKKWLGNKGNYYNEFKKWLPKEDVKKETILPVKKELLLTPEQLAEKLGLTERTIQKQCRNGLHPGAKKIGGKWSIPYVED